MPFASAAQGRVLGGCCTGLTPTPGSLGNTTTVLVPVFAFTMELFLGASVRDARARCQLEILGSGRSLPLLRQCIVGQFEPGSPLKIQQEIVDVG